MALGFSHHTEPVTLGTFHGQSLTATVDRYELRLRAFGMQGHWCALRPRAVEMTSAAGVRSVDLRGRAARSTRDVLRRVLATLGR